MVNNKIKKDNRTLNNNYLLQASTFNMNQHTVFLRSRYYVMNNTLIFPICNKVYRKDTYNISPIFLIKIHYKPFGQLLINIALNTPLLDSYYCTLTRYR